MTNCLVIPSTYVEVKYEEVEYEDGGKFLSALLGAIGGLCGTAAGILGIIARACTIACVFLKW